MISFIKEHKLLVFIAVLCLLLGTLGLFLPTLYNKISEISNEYSLAIERERETVKHDTANTQQQPLFQEKTRTVLKAEKKEEQKQDVTIVYDHKKYSLGVSVSFDTNLFLAKEKELIVKPHLNKDQLLPFKESMKVFATFGYSPVTMKNFNFYLGLDVLSLAQGNFPTIIFGVQYNF